MAVGFARVTIEKDQIKVIRLKGYDPLIHDETCDEIRLHAKGLNLSCLRYLDGAMSCLFDYEQCQEMLVKEIPLLRTKNLSKHAQKALDGLQYVIQDTTYPWGFLSFDAD